MVKLGSWIAAGFVFAACLTFASRGGESPSTLDSSIDASALSPFTEMARLLALETKDAAVAAAANYNLKHLQALSSDRAARQLALEWLADSGDAFTLGWLETKTLATASSAEPEAILRTLERIRSRLRSSPDSPAKAAEALLLSAAVSDLTCNALESNLKQYLLKWLSLHSKDPVVRRQLDAMAQAPHSSKEALSPEAVRTRAASYARRALQGSAAANAGADP